MFIYQQKLPDNPTFAPNFDSGEAAEASAGPLWDATRDLQIFRDNANAEEQATAEAYERRNRAIFEATGVQLANPYRLGHGEDDERALAKRLAGGDQAQGLREELERKWQADVRALAADRPEHAATIAADRAIREDAYAITRDAEQRFAAADQASGGLGGGRRLLNILGGGIAGILRDPLQVATLTVGGGISGASRTVVGRIVSMMFTEAAVNAGVEAGVQLAAQDYKRRAGVEHGFGDAIGQVGIAAAFGGGFGGLLAGATEVLRLTGKAVPDEVLQRAAQGTPEPGDIETIGTALGLKLDPQAQRAAELAIEQPALDRAAFGPPPAEISEAAAEALAARTVRAIEDPPRDAVPRVDAPVDQQERFEAIERIVRQQQPLGPAPKKPVTLTQFLAGDGGLADDGGELAAMGLSRKFVPGSGALVRRQGKRLDMAREAAAEAGYFDDLYGDPDRAVAESTVDDLLRLLRQEAGGEPVFSPRNDGGRNFEWLDYDQRQKAQDAYRQLVGRIDTAAQDIGLDKIDDAIVVRAAELVDDETDELAALERALDEDYRSYADAYTETGAEPFDDLDIPFFDEDARPGAQAGRADGGARADGAVAGRGADAADRDQLPRAGGDEGSPPLREPGATPEPGTPEAGEIAALALTEATPSGEQTLVPGVKPVSTRERLEAQGRKPLRGGDKPAGGMFDETKTKQPDMWDAIPAARTADGGVSHVTHAELVDDAARDELFGDLIASCKD